MLSLEDFREALTDELGDAVELVRDEHLLRWVNRGRARLGLHVAKDGDVTWVDAAAEVVLPIDCVAVDRIVAKSGSSLPAHVVQTDRVAFLEPTCVSAGEATVYYRAEYPAVTGQVASTMPASADEAVVSFALSRFFLRVASQRSDFRRYAQITGQNGVDVQDLADLADQHYRDFLDARGDVPSQAPATFFGD